MSPLSPRTSSYFDHNSENTIMDNFEFIIQFYTLFPPSLGSGMTLSGERSKVRGASEHRSRGMRNNDQFHYKWDVNGARNLTS